MDGQRILSLSQHMFKHRPLKKGFWQWIKDELYTMPNSPEGKKP
jgi:hypothetical protein